MTLYPASIAETRSEFVFLDSGCHRDNTVALREQAIKRVIVAIRERFMETLTLSDLAAIAQLSPFHFNRVFKSMTGIAPSVFIASIRIEEAKKLLLTTDRRVTDVCFDVGYKSLGTFTSRFSQFVGVSPTGLRRLAQEQMMLSCPADFGALLQYGCSLQNDQKEVSVTGTIEIAEPFQGVIFVGVFLEPLPQGEPIGCTIMMKPGVFSISALPDGKYYLFAIALDGKQDLLSFLQCRSHLHGGLGKNLLVIHKCKRTAPVKLCLTRTNWVDPPILIALPWLLISRINRVLCNANAPVELDASL